MGVEVEMEVIMDYTLQDQKYHMEILKRRLAEEGVHREEKQ